MVKRGVHLLCIRKKNTVCFIYPTSLTILERHPFLLPYMLTDATNLPLVIEIARAGGQPFMWLSEDGPIPETPSWMEGASTADFSAILNRKWPSSLLAASATDVISGLSLVKTGVKAYHSFRCHLVHEPTICFEGFVLPAPGGGGKIGLLLMRTPSEVSPHAYDFAAEADLARKAKRAEQRVSSILKAMPEVVLVIDADGNYQEVLSEDPSLLAAPAHEIIGKNIREFLSAPVYEVAMQMLKKVLETGETLQMEYPIEISGQTRWFHARVTACQLEENKAILWASHEITKRKKAEQALVESERKYRYLFENAHEGIFQTTLDGRYLMANPALASMYGFDSAEALMKSRNDIGQQAYVNPEDRQRFLDLMEEQGYVQGFEYEVVRKDGTKIWFYEDAHAVYDSDGKIAFFEGFVADITERKKAEAELQQRNEDLQKVNEELDRFLYSVSHDLRAPISSVVGLLDIIQNTHAEEERDRYFHLARKSLRRLDDYVKDIVDLAKNAKMDVVMEPVNLYKIISDVCDELNFSEDGQKVEKNIRVEQTNGLVFSDPKRLKIILQNLISNAVRYHNPYTEKPQVNTRAYTDGAELVLEVTDNGLGISSDHLPHIFELFYRAHQVKLGSGMGLFIVKETVEKLGGNIAVESTVNKGSTFRIRLPQACLL